MGGFEKYAETLGKEIVKNLQDPKNADKEAYTHPALLATKKQRINEEIKKSLLGYSELSESFYNNSMMSDDTVDKLKKYMEGIYNWKNWEIPGETDSFSRNNTLKIERITDAVSLVAETLRQNGIDFPGSGLAPYVKEALYGEALLNLFEGKIEYGDFVTIMYDINMKTEKLEELNLNLSPEDFMAKLRVDLNLGENTDAYFSVDADGGNLTGKAGIEWSLGKKGDIKAGIYSDYYKGEENGNGGSVVFGISGNI